MAKRQRGRESAGDMVRSLGLVLAMVVVVFLLAQPPGSDKKQLRVVDASGDVQAFSQVAPDVPVPRTLPGWRSNVSEYDREGNVLRVGYVTAKGGYAEYDATTAPTPAYLRDLVGDVPQDGTVDIGGVTWRQYRTGGAISLARDVGGALVVLGSKRDSASLDELRVLARSLTS
ncbi:MAG: DUF4245 domain-containing protein [Actinobacteria bacterium]|nr:DUF4245 domain-containing protein [Actinomycetota bacterium]